MGNLIIFDIDGTLIHTTSHEDTIYINAVKQVIGSSLQIDTDWTNYRYSTDAGVFSEIVQKSLSRPPVHEEKQEVETRFVTGLKDLFSTYSLCQSIEGAHDIFDQLKAIGWDIAIATGCWKSSAELKLKNAGLLNQNIPIANSSDCYDRKDIIQVAIERAKETYNCSAYSRMIYVGDKLWDKNAAHLLGIEFIGIGAPWREVAQGAFFHTPDYASGDLITYLKS